MNALVVYDSQYGNTEKIAQQIAKTLSEFGTARAERVSDVLSNALEGIELLIVGCPTQAWSLTDVMRDFFAALKPAVLKRVLIAVFDTRLDKPRLLTGSAAEQMAKQFKRRGVSLLLKPKSFLVTGMEGPLAHGELEHAAEWAHDLHDEFELEMEPLVVPM